MRVWPGAPSRSTFVHGSARRASRPRTPGADALDFLIGMVSGSAGRLRIRNVCEGSLGFRRRRPHPLEGAVNGGPSDAEEFREFGLGTVPEDVYLWVDRGGSR
jgi:hypothetical protein